ncbi:hypothetical protein SEA_NANOSMITE_36 [Mycobacterium phage Nanosmite]|nr:hypothetical protein SEA_NANOSMITE_36 [Mycobacterium phage Nanosmite]
MTPTERLAWAKSAIDTLDLPEFDANKIVLNILLAVAESVVLTREEGTV